MKLSVIPAFISSILMVAELSFAKICDSIVSTNPPADELTPDQLKGDGEWRMESIQFHMKIDFEAENSSEPHPNPINEQLKGLIDSFGATATTKTDLSTFTSKSLDEIKQGFNAQDFVTLDCMSGVSNTEEKSNKDPSITTTTLERDNIHGNTTLPYSIDRSSLKVNLLISTGLNSKNEESPTSSVVQAPVEQFSLQDLYDERDRTPPSPDRTTRLWMEVINDEQIKIILTYAGREAKTMDFNISESQSVNDSIVRQSNDTIPVDGKLIISAQVVGIYSLRK